MCGNGWIPMLAPYRAEVCHVPGLVGLAIVATAYGIWRQVRPTPIPALRLYAVLVCASIIADVWGRTSPEWGFRFDGWLLLRPTLLAAALGYEVLRHRARRLPRSSVVVRRQPQARERPVPGEDAAVVAGSARDHVER